MVLAPLHCGGLAVQDIVLVLYKYIVMSKAILPHRDLLPFHDCLKLNKSATSFNIHLSIRLTTINSHIDLRTNDVLVKAYI